MDSYFEWRMVMEQAWICTIGVFILGALGIQGFRHLARKFRG